MPSLKMNFWISHSAIKLIIEVFSILFLWIRVGVVNAWIASMSHHTQPQSVLFVTPFSCLFDCGVRKIYSFLKED